MSESFAPDASTCALCHRAVPTEPVNVGDDVSSRLLDVCSECNRTKLLPPDW